MNKSFHYYCIRVLAEKAGFSADDAQTIAYASQYTDDSSEHGKMRITNIPDTYEYPRWNRSQGTFDPICTAHSGKGWLAKVWKWAKFYLKTDVQRRILMVYHFLPGDGMAEEKRDNFHFITEKNSELSNLVVDEALGSIRQSNDDTYLHAIIKVGIALHTYADTWSHNGFSGRHSSLENDIKKIRIKKGSNYKSVNPLESIVSYAAPDVGHAEGSTIPDVSNIDWDAKYANKRGGPGHDNSQEFIDAAREIYERLTSIFKQPNESWDNISERVGRCLKENGGWENIFPDIEFRYSRFTWRAAALSGDSIDWDNFDDESDFNKLNFRYTGNDMRWLFFHKAAYEQRKFLDDKIPKSWVVS